jgi:hypothetical protein
VKRSLCAVLIAAVMVALALPAQAASPASGTITRAKRSLAWSGGPFVVSEPAPDPSGLNVYAPSCHGDSMCDHFALSVHLGDGARVRIAITTARPNPPGSIAQPVTGDDYDLYVYDPTGALLTGMSGATEKGDESVTITHRKAFNGKDYDVAVRPWAVLPGSTYQGSVKALSLGR